ncbi:thrombospondin type 3 repeat-containing protein, partial [Candidatus Woesearchaeota archaeon]|nr:thrombospondin type 3 repeat-containing protein [Candidatus Woesearchaeota archaeon]
MWELRNGLDPLNPTDKLLDPDNDGLSNFKEFTLDTNPLKEDTDDDGYADGVEIEKGTDPNDSEDHPTSVLFIMFMFFLIIVFIGALGMAIYYYYVEYYSKGMVNPFEKHRENIEHKLGQTPYQTPQQKMQKIAS